MLLDILKSHLNPECAIVYREISEFCGNNVQAATMLSKFVYWADVKARTEPQSQGWFYKTAAELKEELGLTRRGYEKARRFLLDKGIIQYRRGGVHGKMHWFVNVAELLRKIYTEVKKETVPKNLLKTQIDIDNYNLKSYIPRDAWNAYVQMRKQLTSKGGRPALTRKTKKRLLDKLAQLHKEGWDLKQIIERSTERGYFDFFAPDYQPATAALTVHDPEADKVMAQINAQREQQAKQDANKPPSARTTPEKAQKNTQALLNQLKSKMTLWK